MSKIIEKPHFIFLFTIPIIILIGILNRDTTLDINVHDTYFVIFFFHLAMLISILFGIIGLGYRIMKETNKRLSKWLNLIHIGLTFGGVIITSTSMLFYRDEVTEYKFNNNMNLIITLITLFTILGQIVFPINMIYGLRKKQHKSIDE
ncbi:hypothetical protein GTQ40_16210 [Flavobacteriaceae bacterium R38]|nr:hypothetical protein [Flavobacteriaceae bacterium R38]